MPDYIKEIKGSEEVKTAINDVNVRVEDSGYLTFVDMDKDESE